MERIEMDKRIFWGSLIVVVFIIVPLFFGAEQGLAILNGLKGLLTEKFGWLYMWFTVIVFGVLVWLAFGKYGNIKFGNTDPEFSTLSWLAMIFTTGIGGGIMYWGVVEWAYYNVSPPFFDVEPKSTEALHWAASYGLFHWGFSAWAIYCLPALPIAYAFHVKKRNVLRLSEACRGVLGKHSDGWVGKLIDIFFIFGIIGGAGTSLGLEAPMISQGISELTGINQSLLLDTFVIAIWTSLFSISAYLGLRKGIKRLSDFNIYLALVFLAFILIFGPTVFILTTFTNSVGMVLQNFAKMSFNMDFVNGFQFTQDWTVFYWGWWFAYAPFVGLFTARISKGRTIRELILGMCLAGSAGCWIIFAILGNTSIYFDLNGIVPVTDILLNNGAPAAIIATLQGLPIGSIMLVTYLILMMIFLATMLDSSAFIMAFVASKNMKSELDPPKWHRVFWAVILGAVAIIMMYGGGLEPLQTLSIIAGFPLMFIFILMFLSLSKWLKEDELNKKIMLSKAETASTQEK